MKILKGNINLSKKTFDLIIFSSFNEPYAEYMYCNILSIVNQTKSDLKYKIVIRTVGVSEKYINLFKSIPEVELITDVSNGVPEQYMCQTGRFSYFYTNVLKNYNSKCFFILDADLIIMKDLKPLVDDFCRGTSDICTKTRKISNKLRALGIQLIKNTDNVHTLFSHYNNKYEEHVTGKKFRQIDWHIYEEIMEYPDVKDVLTIDDFSKFNLTDYVPFLHGNRHRLSDWYREKMRELKDEGFKR